MEGTGDPLEELRALCRRVERRSARLRGSRTEQLAALAELDDLHPHVIAGLTWCRARGRRSEAMQLIAALARFWWIRGLGPEVQGLVDEVLPSRGETIDPRAGAVAHRGETIEGPVVAAARQGAGELAYARADYDAARRHLELARDTCLELDDRLGESHATNWLGMVDREQGRYPDAVRRHQQVLDLYAEASHQWGRAHALSNLGVVAYRRGELDRALQLHQQALAIRRSIDDLHGLSSSQGNLALLHRTRGDHAEARSLYLQSLEGREQLGDRWGIAGSRVCLCAVETRLGDPDSAHDHLSVAIRGFIEVGDALGIAESAQAALTLFVQTEAFEDACTALAIVEAVRRLIDAPVPTNERPDVDELRRRLDRECGCEAVETHIEWAARATMAEAIEQLLSLAR